MKTKIKRFFAILSYRVYLFRGVIRREFYKHWRWYWYRGIPFVVAEVINKEWDRVKELPGMSTMKSIYNFDGNWYVLESPFYWFLGINIKEFCFYDSLHLEHTNMSDDERWLSMKNRALSDIDSLFRNSEPKIWRKIESGLYLTRTLGIKRWKSIVEGLRILRKK